MGFGKVYECVKGQAQQNLDMDKFKKLEINICSQTIQKKCIEIFKEKEEYLNNMQLKIEKEKQYIDELKKLGKDIIASYCA